MAKNDQPTTFPNFKKIDIHHKELINKFIEKYAPYSDFNFTSMWIYNTNSQASFTWLNSNLVVSIPDYMTNKVIFSFLGENSPIDTINKIIDYIKHEDLNAEIDFIPEVSIKNYLNSDQVNFTIEENPDQHDYIIPLKESAELTNIHHRKHLKYKHFIENHSKHEVKEIFLNDLNNQKIILKLFRKWAKQKDKSASEINTELIALKRLLKYNQHFNLITHGLFIENQLVGYIIDERIHASYIMGHFIKADMDFPGVYEVLNKVTADIHYNHGYKYINIEQDLGIPGLRLSKSQRSPVFYLKKFMIKPLK